MEGRHGRASTYGILNEENVSLSQLIQVIEISIGHAHSIIHSIEDITRLPRAADPASSNRDSGYSDAPGLIHGGDLNRRLSSLERKIEENRAYLRDLQKANFRGLQIIVEDPEGGPPASK